MGINEAQDAASWLWLGLDLGGPKGPSPHLHESTCMHLLYDIKWGAYPGVGFDRLASIILGVICHHKRNFHLFSEKGTASIICLSLASFAAENC